MCKLFIKLSSCPMDTTGKDLAFGKESSSLPEYNATYGTLRLYEDEEAAIPRAVRILDAAIEDWGRRGYVRRTAPHTVNDEHHNWRRIVRVGRPGRPSVCLQVVIDGVEVYFDPWTF